MYMTTIILTGATAIVRATAYTMETKGVTYPGRDIRDFMRDADISHMSNEVPFLTGCDFPNPSRYKLIFCSDPKYIKLLIDIGINVVELTGNHFADYGRRTKCCGSERSDLRDDRMYPVSFGSWFLRQQECRGA